MIDPKQIDLPMLRVFDALMQTRHVTQAGVNLGLSQPSVSFALNKLRALTQDELFVRSPGGMTPTPLAQQMADTVRQILDMVDNDLLGRPASTRPPRSATSRSVCLISARLCSCRI